MRAFSASFCSFVSIVRTSELPAIGGVSTPTTRIVRPVPSFSTRCVPYVPRSSVLVDELDAGLADPVVRAGSPASLSSV